jgi:hypothetical protein
VIIMTGPLLIVTALAMLGIGLVPGVRRMINPIYVGIWIAVTIMLFFMGLFYVLMLLE